MVDIKRDKKEVEEIRAARAQAQAEQVERERAQQDAEQFAKVGPTVAKISQVS